MILIGVTDNTKALYLISCSAAGAVSGYAIKALGGASSISYATNKMTISAAAAINGCALIIIGSMSD